MYAHHEWKQSRANGGHATRPSQVPTGHVELANGSHQHQTTDQADTHTRAEPGASGTVLPIGGAQGWHHSMPGWHEAGWSLTVGHWASTLCHVKHAESGWSRTGTDETTPKGPPPKRPHPNGPHTHLNTLGGLNRPRLDIFGPGMDIREGTV